MPEKNPKQRRKLAAILMADVSGFSRLMGEDEERTTERMQDFHRRVKGMIEAHDGRLVDTAGDSAFGEFDSVVNAVRCADQVQLLSQFLKRNCHPILITQNIMSCQQDFLTRF